MTGMVAAGHFSRKPPGSPGYSDELMTLGQRFG